MEVELIRQAPIFSAINYIITGTEIFRFAKTRLAAYQHQLFMNSPFRLLDLQNLKSISSNKHEYL